AAPPVDGAANDALIAFLSAALGIPRRQITIVSGERSRDKRVRIAGIGTEAGISQLLRYMLLIRHLRPLVTCAGAAPHQAPHQTKPGGDRRPIAIVEDGAIAADGERVLFARRDGALPAPLASAPCARTIDGRTLSAVPGFVDAHTHAIFAGDRRGELRRRLAGASYAEIAAAGGRSVSTRRAPPQGSTGAGIVSTVRATREASEADLVAATRARLGEMLACGTTTAEIKSGYGLDVESELKKLRAIRQLAASQPVDLAPTFIG